MNVPKPKGYACLDRVKDGTKKPHLCTVKHCRNDKVVGRSVCYKHHLMSWRINNPLKASYRILKDHATRRKLKFTLTLEQYESIVIPSGYLDSKGNTRYDLHLDRIDPFRGYEYDNIQVLTCSENSAKGATKDKSKYVAERLARLGTDAKGRQEPEDDNCPF